MSSFREPEPLATYFVAQQKRVLEALGSFTSGDGAGALLTVRTLVCALRDAEAEVLYPALARLQLPLELQYLLADSRDSRARQLDALDALARKRTPRLRKLAAVALADQIQHHAQQHVGELIPVLASRLPRAVHRAIAARFIARAEQTIQAAKPERRRRAA